MKKLVYKKLSFDILKFFLITIFSISTIVWIIQAVNFLDLVSEDGHSLKVYFFYTFFLLPKIISNVLPFILLISLFYVLIQYEIKNELIIYWINGITKINLTNHIIKITILFVIFHLILNLGIVPYSLDKARSYFRNSNVDLFSAIIKEKKFIDSVENLTIFVEKKNGNKLENIFIKEKISEENSQIIIAQNGNFEKNEIDNKIILENGKIIDTKEDKQNIIDFSKFNLDLSKFQSNTITNPKTQEMSSINLFKCIVKIHYFKNNNNNNNKSFFPGCDTKIYKAIYEEFNKRFFSPIFTINIGLIASLLLIVNKQNNNYKKKYFFNFCLGVLLIFIAEITLKHLTNSITMIGLYLLIPIILFLLIYSYLQFVYKFKLNFK